MTRLRKELIKVETLLQSHQIDRVCRDSDGNFQSELIDEIAHLRAEVKVQKMFNSKAVVEHINNQNQHNLERMLVA